MLCQWHRPLTVHADDALLYDSGQRHPVEDRVEALPRPNAALLTCTMSHVRALLSIHSSKQHQRTQALHAFHPEAEQRVDVCSLVVAPQEVHIFGVLNLVRVTCQMSCKSRATHPHDIP